MKALITVDTIRLKKILFQFNSPRADGKFVQSAVLMWERRDTGGIPNGEGSRKVQLLVTDARLTDGQILGKLGAAANLLATKMSDVHLDDAGNTVLVTVQ